jgi:hypothetical protein
MALEAPNGDIFGEADAATDTITYAYGQGTVHLRASLPMEKAGRAVPCRAVEPADRDGQARPLRHRRVLTHVSNVGFATSGGGLRYSPRSSPIRM